MSTRHLYSNRIGLLKGQISRYNFWKKVYGWLSLFLGGASGVPAKCKFDHHFEATWSRCCSSVYFGSAAVAPVFPYIQTSGPEGNGISEFKSDRRR